jgi:hypothetical protein
MGNNPKHKSNRKSNRKIGSKKEGFNEFNPKEEFEEYNMSWWLDIALNIDLYTKEQIIDFINSIIYSTITNPMPKTTPEEQSQLLKKLKNFLGDYQNKDIDELKLFLFQNELKYQQMIKREKGRK